MLLFNFWESMLRILGDDYDDKSITTLTINTVISLNRTELADLTSLPIYSHTSEHSTDAYPTLKRHRSSCRLPFNASVLSPFGKGQQGQKKEWRGNLNAVKRSETVHAVHPSRGGLRRYMNLVFEGLEWRLWREEAVRRPPRFDEDTRHVSDFGLMISRFFSEFSSVTGTEPETDDEDGQYLSDIGLITAHVRRLGGWW